MATKFSTEVAFWQVETCAKFYLLPKVNCPPPPPPGYRKPKKPGLNVNAHDKQFSQTFN